MMDSIQSVYSRDISPVVKREKIQLFAVFSLAFLLFIALISAILVIVSLNDKLEDERQGMRRSKTEMINGGKRFLDGFFSLNAATVEGDQFSAVAMLVSPEMATKRSTYLAQNDLIRKTQSQHFRTYIDWSNADVDVLDSKIPGTMRAEYRGYIVIVNKDNLRVAWHMVLDLSVVKRTNENSSGIGIVNYRDLAEEPFEEKS
ncbi:MAG: hypothetical protein HRU20_21600 [Pseudomonadales bacterium]|nr:hypothetical protein [Pseudomonadales bacterium]